MADQISRHQAVIPASAHDPAQIPAMLASIIGQLQHLIDLAELAQDQSPYDPIVVDLSTSQSITVHLPNEAHTVAQLHITTSTAATIQIYRVDQRSGPSGQLIGALVIPANGASGDITLNAPMPPTGAQLLITSSAAITTGFATIRLLPARLGGYPYAS